MAPPSDDHHRCKGKHAEGGRREREQQYPFEHALHVSLQESACHVDFRGSDRAAVRGPSSRREKRRPDLPCALIAWRDVAVRHPASGSRPTDPPGTESLRHEGIFVSELQPPVVGQFELDAGPLAYFTSDVGKLTPGLIYLFVVSAIDVSAQFAKSQAVLLCLRGQAVEVLHASYLVPTLRN